MTSVKINKTLLSLVQGDITAQEVDAIVNAANSSLMGGGGVDGAIHRAGGSAILAECKVIVKRQGPLLPGDAVITTGGKLPTKSVIHTVGPIWHGGKSNEPEILKSAYRKCLTLAAEKKLKTIAFPSISTGAYGYPVELAAALALSEVANFLKQNETLKEVRFVLYDARTLAIYREAVETLIS